MDRVDRAVQRALELIASGNPGSEQIESKHVDLKEEPGLRRGSETLPSGQHNESAAKYLAAEAACMANTDFGGALILGVQDDGTPVGTQLDIEWLRLRIHELTQRQLTVNIREVIIPDARILVIKCPEAVGPISVKNRITWRVADSCVEVDAASWRARRYTRVDWSAQSSGLPVSAARDVAIGRARDYLRESLDPMARELAMLPTSDLLQRINVTTADGELTNAGAIAFVGRISAPALDYLRRDSPGAASRVRVRLENRGLIEELYEVERAAAAANSTTHLLNGLSIAQALDIPELAIREVLVNSCVHRDWNNPEASTIEHISTNLTVTSPGGFPEGVTSDNILTHPSTSRNRSLVDLFARLRIAERQGIGIDMITREMLRLGHSRPEIEEVHQLYVRASLIGGPPRQDWILWLNHVTPPEIPGDVFALLLLDHLFHQWWVDAASAAKVLQVSPAQAERALAQLAHARWRQQPVIDLIGTPLGSTPAYRLNPASRAAVRSHPARQRAEIALDWVRQRGRISTTELANILAAKPSNMRSILQRLLDEGLILPARANRRGAGFFYLPTHAP
ncbi:MAG: ATP-binding protein [Angustibacter sp.]